LAIYLLHFFLPSSLYKYTDNIVVLYWAAVVGAVSVFRYEMLRRYNKKEHNEKDVYGGVGFLYLPHFCQAAHGEQHRFYFCKRTILSLCYFC